MNIVKIEIYNGSNRQVWIDTKGKNLPEDIYPVGLQETVILDIEYKEIDRIKATLPTSVQVQIN